MKTVVELQVTMGEKLLVPILCLSTAHVLQLLVGKVVEEFISERCIQVWAAVWSQMHDLSKENEEEHPI